MRRINGGECKRLCGHSPTAATIIFMHELFPYQVIDESRDDAFNASLLNGDTRGYDEPQSDDAPEGSGSPVLTGRLLAPQQVGSQPRPLGYLETLTAEVSHTHFTHTLKI